MDDPMLASEARFGAVARTARWTAAARARESSRPDRLFCDPLAGHFAGEEGAELLRHFDTSRAADGGSPFLAIRTRWFDDRITEAVAAGSRQVVALAAGLDARAYRLDWPPGTVLFELDQDHLLTYKEQRLAAWAAEPRCDVRRLRVDLTGDWEAALLTAGFDPSRPAVWFVEGLLYYLPESLAKDLLSRVAELSAAGSVLTADYVNTGMFRFPYMRALLRKLSDVGSPWQFGTDDSADFTESCGWSRVTVTEPGEPGADFGRWRAQAASATMPDLPRSYLVAAERA